METVSLEWISSLEVEPRDVVQFVQQLSNVPEDADERRTRNEVQLSCESRVSEFLCRRFSKQTQHVTGGEVIRVRCKRMYPGVKPPGKMVTVTRGVQAAADCGEGADEQRLEVNTQVDITASAVPILPIDKVIALIDLLGDQVVDAQEAYELFADSDARTPQRMALLGLTKALAKLRQNEWTAKQRAHGRAKNDGAADCTTQVTMEDLRYLLSRLIASNNVAVRWVPAATTVPFLSYTDFLACYVADLASLHSSR